MKLTKLVAATMTVGALGIGIAGAPAASAAPAVPAPLQPGHGQDDCFPFCNGQGPGRDNGRGPDFNRGNWNNNRGDWNNNDHGNWDNKGPWWANNRHDWWDDRNGPPPWGWGPPPPYQWQGGPLPQTINYWGYNLTPVWNDGPRQWGVWLFGMFIPIFGVG